STTYGHFTIDASGIRHTTSYSTYSTVLCPSAPSTPLTDTITVTTADGTTHDIVITINGANDAATFTGADTGSVTEDGVSPSNPNAGGTLIVADVDSSTGVTEQTNESTT